MKCLFLSKTVPFYLAVIAFAAMPLVAQAQQTDDDGSGPPPPATQSDSTSATHHRASVERESAADQSAIADTGHRYDEKNADDDTTPPGERPQPNNAKFVAGGTMGSGSDQIYGVGGQLTLQGNGAYGSVQASVGGTPSQAAFQTRADMTNVRITSNGYNAQGVTVTGTMDASAQIDTHGNGHAMGIIAPTLLIPFTKAGNCFLNFGPAVGGQVVNNVGVNSTTSSVAGAGGYTAVYCAKGRFGGAVTNSFIFDTTGNGPTAVAEQKANLQYFLTKNVSTGATAYVDEAAGGPKYAGMIHLDYNVDIGAGDADQRSQDEARKQRDEASKSGIDE